VTAPSAAGARSAYDPFAPSAGHPFPERRLRRAGLDDAAVNRLREEWDTLGAPERRELARYVTRSPDPRIRDRFGSRRSRTELEGLTVAQLEPLLRERRLSTDGRKADLIDRLTASYEGAAEEQPTRAPQEAATAPEPAAPAGNTPDAGQAAQGEQEAPQEQPPAPEQQDAPAPEATPAAAPQPEPAAEAPAVPTPTPDAAPAPDTAAPADTTTTEEADRG
jgi:SAP domain